MTISIVKNHSGDTVGIITGCYAQLDHSYSWALEYVRALPPRSKA